MPDVRSPTGDDVVAEAAKEKLAGYVTSHVADRVRDAVAALGGHADDPASLSEFLEHACIRELARLEQDRNDGKPFPPRARRRLVSGPRPS